MWIITCISLVLQIATVIFACRLNILTGNHRAWWFLTAASFVVFFRRIYSIYLLAFDFDRLNPIMEVSALIVSILFLAGMVSIKPLFEHIKSRQYEAMKFAHASDCALKVQYRDLLKDFKDMSDREKNLENEKKNLENIILNSIKEIGI